MFKNFDTLKYVLFYLFCFAVFTLLLFYLDVGIVGVRYWMEDKSCFTNIYHLKLYCYRLINYFFPHLPQKYSSQLFICILTTKPSGNLGLLSMQMFLHAANSMYCSLACSQLFNLSCLKLSFHFSKVPNILLDRFLRVSVFYFKFWYLILK